ncbi:Type II inositol 1,4,5-trisphosphate 5-phosphatase [Balamuthia mandrillaris]
MLLKGTLAEQGLDEGGHLFLRQSKTVLDKAYNPMLPYSSPRNNNKSSSPNDEDYDYSNTATSSTTEEGSISAASASTSTFIDSTSSASSSFRPEQQNNRANEPIAAVSAADFEWRISSSPINTLQRSPSAFVSAPAIPLHLSDGEEEEGEASSKGLRKLRFWNNELDAQNRLEAEDKARPKATGKAYLDVVKKLNEDDATNESSSETEMLRSAIESSGEVLSSGKAKIRRVSVKAAKQNEVRKGSDDHHLRMDERGLQQWKDRLVQQKQKKKEETDDDDDDDDEFMHTPSTAVFGVALGDLLERERRADKRKAKEDSGKNVQTRVTMNQQHPDHCIPKVVEDMLTFLEKEESLKAEGIFRLSGSFRVMDDLKKTIDSGMPVQFDQYEPHVIASLLKMYLNQLPDPLLSYALFDRFLAAVSFEEEDTVRLQYLRSLLASLPPARYVLLQRLLLYMRKVDHYSSFNRMGVANLSTAFSPILLRARENPLSQLSYPSSSSAASSSPAAVFTSSPSLLLSAIDPKEAMQAAALGVKVVQYLVLRQDELFLPPKNEPIGFESVCENYSPPPRASLGADVAPITNPLNLSASAPSSDAPSPPSASSTTEEQRKTTEKPTPTTSPVSPRSLVQQQQAQEEEGTNQAPNISKLIHRWNNSQHPTASSPTAASSNANTDVGRDNNNSSSQWHQAAPSQEQLSQQQQQLETEKQQQQQQQKELTEAEMKVKTERVLSRFGLALKQGDIVYVFRRCGDWYWWGEVNKKIGAFPPHVVIAASSDAASASSSSSPRVLRSSSSPSSYGDSDSTNSSETNKKEKEKDSHGGNIFTKLARAKRESRKNKDKDSTLDPSQLSPSSSASKQQRLSPAQQHVLLSRQQEDMLNNARARRHSMTLDLALASSSELSSPSSANNSSNHLPFTPRARPSNSNRSPRNESFEPTSSSGLSNVNVLPKKAPKQRSRSPSSAPALEMSRSGRFLVGRGESGGGSDIKESNSGSNSPLREVRIKKEEKKEEKQQQKENKLLKKAQKNDKWDTYFSDCEGRTNSFRHVRKKGHQQVIINESNNTSTTIPSTNETPLMVAKLRLEGLEDEAGEHEEADEPSEESLESPRHRGDSASSRENSPRGRAFATSPSSSPLHQHQHSASVSYSPNATSPSTTEEEEKKSGKKRSFFKPRGRKKAVASSAAPGAVSSSSSSTSTTAEHLHSSSEQQINLVRSNSNHNNNDSSSTTTNDESSSSHHKEEHNNAAHQQELAIVQQASQPAYMSHHQNVTRYAAAMRPSPAALSKLGTAMKAPAFNRSNNNGDSGGSGSSGRPARSAFVARSKKKVALPQQHHQQPLSSSAEATASKLEELSEQRVSGESGGGGGGIVLERTRSFYLRGLGGKDEGEDDKARRKMEKKDKKDKKDAEKQEKKEKKKLEKLEKKKQKFGG